MNDQYRYRKSLSNWEGRMGYVIAFIAAFVVGVVGTFVVIELPLDDNKPVEVKWSVMNPEQLDDCEFEVVGSTGGVVMLGTDEGVFEVSHNGTALWGLEVNTGVDGCYRASEDKVAFWVESRGFYVVSHSDGELMWEFEDDYLSVAVRLDGATAALLGTSDGAVFEAHYDGSTREYWDFGSAAKSRGRDKNQIYDVDEYNIWGIWPRDKGFVVSSGVFDIVAEVVNGTVNWSWGSFLVDQPSSIQVMDSGNLLVCDQGNQRILEVDRVDTGGDIVWESYFDNLCPTSAEYLWNGLVLVTCDNGCMAISRDNNVVWTVLASDCNSSQWYYEVSA